MQNGDIDFLENLVRSKSWWDTVDLIASNLIGVLLQKNPVLIVPYTEKWMASKRTEAGKIEPIVKLGVFKVQKCSLFQRQARV